jgi:CHAT domain-containing protein
LTREALSLASSFKVPDIAYRWQWQLGRLLQAQAEKKRQSQNADPEAITAYTSAFNTLQSLRSDLVTINPEVQFNFRDSVEPLYRELVELLLRNKPSQENLKQARNVIEALQLAELDDFFREACVDAKPQQIDRVVDFTEPRTAVFYAIILKNNLQVILKLPEPNKSYQEQKLLYFFIQISQKEVEKTLEILQKYLRNPTRFNDVETLSQQVYNWLIRPFEADLQNSQVKTLVFVLDGLLRNIPMTILYDGQSMLSL